MSEPYLILHKVRGIPAFDIAERLEQGTASDPGPWWIIPTSGHRAYPLKWWAMNDLFAEGQCLYNNIVYDEVTETMLNSVPDHYSTLTPGRPIRQGLQMAGEALLRKIGLATQSKPFQRRRL